MVGSYCFDANRACQVRYFVGEARDGGITVSALHVGPDWDESYGDDEPLREVLLKEIADVDGTSAYKGRYARISPFMCNICDRERHVPGTARDIAVTVAEWFCDDEGIAAFTYDLDGDADAVHDLCDNCVDCNNSDQQDCNRDGIGDICQPTCNAVANETAPDTDGDGLWDGIDTCAGGDDCLIDEWTKHLDCTRYDTCGCDCDHDGLADACHAAIEVELNEIDCDSLPTSNPERQQCEGIPEPCQYDAFDPVVNDFEEHFVLGGADGQFGWAQLSGPADGFVIESDGAGGQVMVLKTYRRPGL